MPMDSLVPSLLPSVRPLNQSPFNPANPNPLPLPPPSSIGSDLRTTISLLKDLAAGAESTLKSVFLSSSSSSNPNSNPFSDPLLIQCPHDPLHRVHPASLFRHSLRCPSSPGSALLDLDFLQYLHYPASLRAESEPRAENRFLTEPGADFCFSLDGNVTTNFFYRDCPGVVCFPDQDRDESTKTFTLPTILSAECANFVCEGNPTASEVGRVQILPSELWALKGEVEASMDNPHSYSYLVLRVASLLCRIKKCSLKKWLISNSPRFGVVIDLAMGDHLFLLLKLCLKVIEREAHCTLELVLSKDGFVDPRSVSFECPRLVGSLAWLASQLSLLYGETNGKSFAVEMLKESLLQAGSSTMIFTTGTERVRDDYCMDGGADGGEDDSSGKVFVSQVAASIAAMHERFLLEERIKALRFRQQIPCSHLINEHSYLSTRACEERKKHPYYRAVMEHDGLLLHQVHNQDVGKVKTREELLAEERDYKRRRMSYRGKTMKRTPIQVIRDIIEEHMEEIKQAGGIGCNVKISANTVLDPAYWNSQSGILSSDTHELRRSRYDPYETSLRSSPQRKQPQAECKVTSRTYKDDSSVDGSIMSNDLQNSHQNLGSGSFEYQEHQKNKKCGRESRYRSKSPINCSSNSQLRKSYAYQRERGDGRACKSEYDRRSSDYSSRSKYYSSRSTLTSSSMKGAVLETRSRKSSRKSESRRSESVTQDALNDRYHPS